MIGAAFKDYQVSLLCNYLNFPYCNILKFIMMIIILRNYLLNYPKTNYNNFKNSKSSFDNSGLKNIANYIMR